MAKENNNDKNDGASPKRKRSAWRVVLLVLAAVVLVIAVAAGFMVHKFLAYGSYQNVPIVTKSGGDMSLTPPPGLEAGGTGNNDDTDSGPVDLNTGTTSIYRRDPIDPNVINVLIIGVDSPKPGANGRSDLNMIASFDKKAGTLKLVSVLRDSLVPIEGHGWNRLNAAYIFGGPGLIVNTVNDVFGLDIQRYVRLDFFGIKDIIDAVGGVDVVMKDNEIAYMRSVGYSVPRGAGVKHLDGPTALEFARIRKLDSDFQRARRQRDVMTAALGKAQSMGVGQALSLMDKLMPNVKTNVGAGETVQLATQILGIRGKQIRQMTVPAEGTYKDKKYQGMDVLSVDFKANEKAVKDFLYGGGQ